MLNSDDEYAVRQERSNWRDASYSNRHREYGWNAPLQDIDLALTNDLLVENTFVEYDNCQPVCFMEMKRSPHARIDLNSAQFKTQKWIADACSKPFFLVEYHDKEICGDDNITTQWFFRVRPINEFAMDFCDQNEQGYLAAMSEVEYVLFLYRIRGRELPENIASKLCTRQPSLYMF